MIPSAARSPERTQRLLEAYLARQTAGKRAGTIPRRTPGSPLPLSFAQEQLWLHGQVAPELPLYNEPMIVYRRGSLDAVALERSLSEFLRRHEAWRSAVRIESGDPVQVILPPAPLALPAIDLRHLPPDAREAEVLRLAREDAARPFDLARGPLLRGQLVHLADEDHRLLLTLHHIIFDGVAIHRVFLPELSMLYASFAAGQPSPLAEPVLQYGDFARWQRDAGPDPAWTLQLEYWRRRLADASVPLPLPTDRPRPRTPTFRGDLERFALPKALSEALKTLSRDERVTLYMTLLAAFKVLLAGYTGQEDIIVGSLTAGRKRPELQEMPGYFVNPVLLRTSLSGDPVFRDVLARVRDTILEALSNDDVPFTHVVRALPHPRDLDRHQLLQVVFSMEVPMPTLDPGWHYSQTDVSTGTAKFDLDLQVEDRPDGILGRVIYPTDLFDATTIRRLVGHYQTLLENIVADPGRRLSALPLLNDEERQEVVVTWNQTGAEYPRSTIHRVFEERAAAAPDATAIVLEHARLSYGELNRRANRLAHRLRGLGVGPGAIVGVCLERSLDLVVAIVGIVKAGAAYLPLDPGYPRELLGFMLTDAGAPLVVTETRSANALPADAAARLCVDTDASLDDESDLDPTVDVGPEDLAYLMYTSGSTGRPKGVAIPHRGILRLVFGQSYVRLDASRVHLQLAPIAFDASTFELWGVLLHGGTCALFPGRVPTLRALAAAIARHQVTTLWLTASLFNHIVDEDPESLAGIEELLIGGEALSVPHVRRALEHLPTTRIVNGYGPTESTTFTCSYGIPRPLDAAIAAIPIGRPIANTQVYVLDRHRHPVPVGVPGELYIGGDGLALRYHGRPALTAETFVPDPFSPGANARLYRTGDLVRWRADGTLDFLGRLDEQLKIRGFRVEPGEVDAALLRHPAIREATVMARDDGARGKTLVAYIVPRSAEGFDERALRTALTEQLAPHMVPASFVVLDRLPLTPSGKVDRRALAADGGAPRAVGPDRQLPRDALEAHLVDIWQELLDVPAVGITDDFFELGGHSLLALRLIQRIAETVGPLLPLTTLYTNPTVAQLATALRGEASHQASPPVTVMRAEGTQPPLFFFHGDMVGGGFYCMKLARHLGPDQPFYVVHPLGRDGDVIPSSIEAIAEMHLRTLRTLRPHGPYRLGGYCNGGLLAYEIARMLTNLGESVDLLLLIAALPDTRYAALRRAGDRIASLLRLPPTLTGDVFGRVRSFLTTLEGQPVRERLRLVLGKIVSLGDAGVGHLRGRAAPDDLRGPATPEHGNRVDAAYLRLYERYFRAVMGYVPRPWPGRIVLLWPVDEPRNPGPDPTLGWGRLAASVEVHPVPGDHSTVVARHAETIAETLRAYL